MIQGEGFTVDESKFDFFFGKVTSNPHNTQRSLSLSEALEQLGIIESKGGRERLLQIFKEGLNSPQIDLVPRPYGFVIVRKIEVKYGNIVGAIEISYFYLKGDLNSVPKITTIITKIYN